MSEQYEVDSYGPYCPRRAAILPHGWGKTVFWVLLQFSIVAQIGCVFAAN